MMTSPLFYLRHLDHWVHAMHARVTAEPPSPTPSDADTCAAIDPIQPVQSEALAQEKTSPKKRPVKGTNRPQKIIKTIATFLAFCLSFLASSCASPRASIKTVHRSEVMATAEAYRQHRWYATVGNVRHDRDRQGIQVDTPDAGFHPPHGLGGWWQPGQWNTGLPYQWGGFDTLAEFDRKIQRGLAAGDVYTTAKRRGLDTAVSQEACGIDCSGFISRCWDLKRSVSTRELPSLCLKLSGYRDLHPGDIINTHNSHVLLFAGWTDDTHTRMQVYEAGSQPEWKVLYRTLPVAFLRQKGYVPLRYRGIRD